MTDEEMIDTLKGLVFGTFDRTTRKEREALDLAIKVLEKTRWISVSERLPDHKGDYLVTFKLLFTYPIEVCYFDGQAWDKGQYDAVLAWMPLPEPYKAKAERWDYDDD